jgi:hypothetical protein
LPKAFYIFKADFTFYFVLLSRKIFKLSNIKSTFAYFLFDFILHVLIFLYRIKRIQSNSEKKINLEKILFWLTSIHYAYPHKEALWEKEHFTEMSPRDPKWPKLLGCAQLKNLVPHLYLQGYWAKISFTSCSIKPRIVPTSNFIFSIF